MSKKPLNEGNTRGSVKGGVQKPATTTGPKKPSTPPPPPKPKR